MQFYVINSDSCDWSVFTCRTSFNQSELRYSFQSLNHMFYAGVRHGAARPRDQPAYPLQVRCPAKNWPVQVEGCHLPPSPILIPRIRKVETLSTITCYNPSFHFGALFQSDMRLLAWTGLPDFKKYVLLKILLLNFAMIS